MMWHLELPLHETLPLGPTVAVHSELPVQLRLHDFEHEPTQVVWFAHESEQLPSAAPQICSLKPQLVPDVQEQLAPEHVGGGALELLELSHAPRSKTRLANKHRSTRMSYYNRDRTSLHGSAHRERVLRREPSRPSQAASATHASQRLPTPRCRTIAPRRHQRCFCNELVRLFAPSSGGVARGQRGWHRRFAG